MPTHLKSTFKISGQRGRGHQSRRRLVPDRRLISGKGGTRGNQSRTFEFSHLGRENSSFNEVHLYIFFQTARPQKKRLLTEPRTVVFHSLPPPRSLLLGLLRRTSTGLCLDPPRGPRQDLMTFIIRWRQEFNLSRCRCQR